ncbi:response regulator transcription factor [Peptoniphilaceae bacterium SGI.131]
MKDKIRLIIADDEQLIRSGLKIMLESLDDIEVVGLASNGKEAYELVRTHRPDIVLMDIRMPVSGGIEGTKLIKESFPDTYILIVTTFQDTEYILEAMKLGASGYLLKDSDYREIYEGIKLVLSGKIVMDREVSSKLVNRTSLGKAKLPDLDLNDKEREIIKNVSKGRNNREIAEIMFLSEGTIKNSISQILLKLDLRDRTQLAIFAIENGLNN